MAALVFLRGRDADARLRGTEAARARVRPALGALAARFVATRAHEALGFRCLGDWSRERLGVGARSVREWARVWRRLEELPLLRGAVLEGEVSWSVARRVVGLVTPETEAASLTAVRGRTLRAVEQMVAAVKQAEASAQPADDDDEREDRARVRIECPAALAERWAAALELARRMAGEALPTWACAEAIAAETAGALGAAQDAATGGAETSHAPDADHQRAADAEACKEHGLRHVAWPGLPWQPVRPKPSPGTARELAQLTDGIDACGAHALDARLRAAIGFLQNLDLELGRILRQVANRRLYRELGFESFERYAAERLDLAPRTARRLVRLARAELAAPRVADAFRAGAITAFQAEVLLRKPKRLARATRVTLRRLEQEVPPCSPTAVAFHAPPEVARLFVGMVELVRARMGPRAAAWQALAAMLEHAIETWEQAGRQFSDYADFERDGWRCTVPGCTARRNLQSHHVVFRSAGGPDEPSNRTTLCAFHHHRGVHTGRVGIRGCAPDGLLYELGVRPGGPPLARYRSGDVLVGNTLRTAAATAAFAP